MADEGFDPRREFGLAGELPGAGDADEAVGAGGLLVFAGEFFEGGGDAHAPIKTTAARARLLNFMRAIPPLEPLSSRESALRPTRVERANLWKPEIPR